MKIYGLVPQYDTRDSFSGYADAYILPYGCEEAENPGYIWRNLDSTGFVVL